MLADCVKFLHSNSFLLHTCLYAQAIAGKDGKMKTITIKSYHCESCRSFIRSTDEKRGMMKKTNFDKYLEEQLKDPAFAARFEGAGEAWDVALQIAALRQEAGLSQKNLAKLLKVPQQQISRLESPGYEGHSLSTLRRVARVLHARVRVVFEPEKKERGTRVAETAATYRSKRAVSKGLRQKQGMSRVKTRF